MNQAYRLIWNERLATWSVVPEIASARGKRGRIQRAAGAALLSVLIGTHATLAADLAATALPGGAQVTVGQAAISTSANRMEINQGSQRAIINWQNFDIGSQAQVNFLQPNASAVALNRVSGPTVSRIEGQLTANGQVFLINPNGVLFGSGARVSVGGLVASTLNIRDDDFLSGNYVFSGSGGSITNQGQITAAPGGYLAFVSPSITNNGSISAPGGTVAMGAGERVRLNFAGDRLVGLDVSADTIDTLITNNQAIRAEGGAILLTAAGAESVTRGVINNTGVLEASSLTQDGGRIVLTAGNDINLGAASMVAVDGKKGGEITVQAQAGTLLADGRIAARGASGTGGTVKLLGQQVGVVNAAQVDASGATGGGTVLIGGDYQGKKLEIQNAARTYVSADATIKADANARGDGGKVVVWADEITRYYGSISARGGAQGGNGGLVEVSGKRDLEFLGAVDVAAPMGTGGRVLLDPQDIVLNTSTQPAPPNNPNGVPDVAFGDPPAVGTLTIQIADITGFSELFLQATRDITVGGRITMAANNNIRLEANNNITLVAGATAATRGSIATSGSGFINLKADADGDGAGNLAMNNATLTSNVGGIVLSGASISGTGTINTTGAANGNGGNIAITGTSAAGSINLTGAITTTGGAAANSVGRNAGNVTINGAGAVTTGAITANGSNGNGANQAGGNGGAIQITSTSSITANGTINATGGNGVAGIAAGGNSGSINLSNSGAGTVQTGALVARNGAASTSGAGGGVGSIAVTNTAGNVTLGALTTSGQANGNGGNINVNATGLLTLNGAIASSGGTNAAATTQAGKNAGSITLAGNGGITAAAAATITASGSAGLGTNQAGGNAGTVALTSPMGAISARAITARTGAATGIGAGGAAGAITLSGASVTTNAGALTTTGGANGDGGSITATASTGLLNVGVITTSGGTANANTAGKNAGAVTLSGDSVTTLGITANGTNGNTAGAGGNGGNVSVTGTVSAVTVGAISTIGGNGVGGNLAGGNAGTITLDAGATTPTITLGGNLTATGGNRVGTGAAGSGGQIWLKDAVLLNAAAITAGAQGGSAGAGAGANVRFDGTINSTGGARALTVNTNAATIFGGAVGGASALTSLTTNASGTTSIGGNVTTTGAQTYNDAVTLTGNAILTGTTPTFASTVAGGGNDLTLNFSGTTTVNGANFTGIRNLATGNSGTTQLTGVITTSGSQTYSDAVTLTGATTLASTGAGNIGLGNTVNGAQALIVNTTGATTFAGAVGGTTALTSLTTNAGGTTSIGGNVTTTGAQTYNDAVTLTGGGTRTFASTGNAAIAFNTTVDGGSAMVVNTTGATTFAGVVGGTTALTSLTTNAGGTTVINGGSVRTTGNQTYGDNVSLGTPTTLSTTANGSITANGSVAANGHLLTLAAGLGNIVMQNVANDFATLSVTSATNVALRDANAIDLGTSTIGANLTLTSGGAVTDSGAISVAGATTINAGVANDVTLDNLNNFAGNVSVQSGRNVRLNDINNLTLDLSTFGTLTATAAGTVTLAGQLTATGTGDAIVLSGGRFVNSAGASALSVPAGSRWLVWSSNPNPFGGATPDNRGGLAYNFKQYNATFGSTTPAQSNGNGFLYSLAPTLTVSLSGTVSKVYDGTTAASLAASNFTYSGSTVDGDLIVSVAGTGAYDNRNAGNGKTVTASAITATATNGSAAVYGYTLAPDPVSANIGTITPAPLTVTAQADNRVYNGTTSSAVAPVLTGTTYDAVGTAATQVYDNKNVGTGKTLTASGLLMNDGNGGANYATSYVTNTSGVITAASLALNAVSDSKVYDATTASSGVPIALGLQAGDSVSSLSQSYQSKNVLGANGSLLLVNGGYVVNDGNGGLNYSVTTNSASGTITPAALAINAVSDSKTYDGSTVSTATPSVGALYGSDSVTGASQAFASRNALGANNSLLNVTGYTINDGNGGLNYSVTSNSASGTITPAPLTVTAQADNRVYNGTTSSAVAPVLTGTTYDAVGTAATQVYDNKNVGTGKTLTASGLLMNDGNGGANYATSYVTNTSGVITAASLALNAVSDSKVYDATTVSSGAPIVLGLQAGDSVSSLSQSYQSKNVLGANGSTLLVDGGYVVNDGNGGLNYSVTTNSASGTITPASLSITADDKSKLFGTPNPPFTATYAGFVGGETPADLGGTLSFLTAAVTTSPPGAYPITPFGQTSGNYAIAYVDGVLTIRGDSVGPVNPGETGADQQAIGAQYANPLFSASYASPIQYLADDDECSNVNSNPEGKCGDGGMQANVVRIVKQGIRLPQ